MATRRQRITDLAVRIAAEFNTAKSERGTLAALTTANKSSLVAAVNELKTLINSIDLTDLIDDVATTAADKTWSIDKIKAELQTAIDNLVAGAPGALDTLNELAGALQSNDGDIASILTAQSFRVRVDAAQAFDTTQKAQGRANIDAASATEVGDTDHDFVTEFEGQLT